MEKLGLSLTQVGVIAGVNRLLAFVVQPSAGYLADRYPTRAFVVIGLLATVIFIPLSGMAPNFWILITVIAIGSVGSSMFHPSVTGMVPVYSGNRTGLAMSIFNTGGTLAFGAGPLFITWYAMHFGLEAVPLTMVFGLLVIGFICAVLPKPQSDGLGHLSFLSALKVSLGPAWKAVALIWLVMFVRAVVGQSFLTFIPVLYVKQGFSLISAGAIFALFTVAGTISGLVAGHISDRIGHRPVFFFCHALMAPVLWLFLQMEGGWVYPGAAMAGGIMLATMPLGVSMAQHLAPKGRSMVASLMMGFAYGLGGIISPLVGKMADLFSINSVLTFISFVPLLTLPMIAYFPQSKSARTDPAL